MGQPLINQRRGKGSQAFRSPSHRYISPSAYPQTAEENRGHVVGLVDDPARTALLAQILLEDGSVFHMIAPEGVAMNQEIRLNAKEMAPGNVMQLKDVADGTPVFNIEKAFKDGGKFCRSSGSTAYVVSHNEERGEVNVKMPSKKIKTFSASCRATVGVACGGGKNEKPLQKAGNSMFRARARNKYYPVVRGTAMSAYDHPHGGKGLGKSTTRGKTTPPGKRVGLIGARASGRRKRRKN